MDEGGAMAILIVWGAVLLLTILVAFAYWGPT